MLRVFISFLMFIFIATSCAKRHAIACPSYMDDKGGDTRGTPLEKGADGKVAPMGGKTKKNKNGIVSKKKDKIMNHNYYRGKKH